MPTLFKKFLTTMISSIEPAKLADKIVDAIKSVTHFVVRHATTAIALYVMFLLIRKGSTDLLDTAYSIVVLELLALLLIYLVLFVFTPIDFIKPIVSYFKEESRDEAKAKFSIAVVCTVIIAVHLLTGAATFGIYFTKYSPMP